MFKKVYNLFQKLNKVIFSVFTLNFLLMKGLEIALHSCKIAEIIHFFP